MVFKKPSLANEIERTMDNFFATATDEQFWATLEDAGWSVFSKIDVPVLEYHCRVSGKYTVTAKSVSALAAAAVGIVGAMSYAQVELVDGALSISIPGSEMNSLRAANSNELALAA